MSCDKVLTRNPCCSKGAGGQGRCFRKVPSRVAVDNGWQGVHIYVFSEDLKENKVVCSRSSFGRGVVRDKVYKVKMRFDGG